MNFLLYNYKKLEPLQFKIIYFIALCWPQQDLESPKTYVQFLIQSFIDGVNLNRKIYFSVSWKHRASEFCPALPQGYYEIIFKFVPVLSKRSFHLTEKSLLLLALLLTTSRLLFFRKHVLKQIRQRIEKCAHKRFDLGW